MVPIANTLSSSGTSGMARNLSPITTSYDCGKATKEMERAICYSPKVAALDLQLGKLYRAALRENADREAMRQQQVQWLAQREKQCTIYKWWVDCLSDLYTKRI